MLLCLRDRFLFVHIAKTGGTSVRAALARRRWRDPLFPAQFLASRLIQITGNEALVKKGLKISSPTLSSTPGPKSS